MLALSYGKPGERVWRRFGDEHSLERDAIALEQGSHLLLEVRHGLCVNGLRHLIDASEYGHDTAIVSARGAGCVVESKGQPGPGRLQQQHIVGLEHGGVRGISVRRPHRPSVEGFEGFAARVHVREAAQPHETILATAIAELTDQRHAGRLLRLDEIALEQVDERVALTRLERVLPQFDDRAAIRLCEGRTHWDSHGTCEWKPTPAHDVDSTSTRA